jgi:hypothetical protein
MESSAPPTRQQDHESGRKVSVVRGRYVAASLFNRLPRWHYFRSIASKVDRDDADGGDNDDDNDNGDTAPKIPLHVLVSATDLRL